MPSTTPSLPKVALITALSLLHSTLASPGFDCAKIVASGIKWDLSPLGGSHSLHWIHSLEPTTRNVTFTLDICKPLTRTKGVPKQEECPTGTRICGIERITEDGHNETTIGQVIPVAGDFTSSHGKPLDSVPTRLKYSDSAADSEKEGLRVELSGGNYDSKNQKAIIEFLCDPERTGLEGDEKGGSDDDQNERPVDPPEKREAADDKENKGNGGDKSLKFISYKDEAIKGDVWGVLRLEWRTKHACEKRADDGTDRASWGFFTWFILILFLGIAAYLVFGSWLNYNRYGARGWDLLPHGDAIRDIPYLMKDWGRRVVGTVQGGSSRGGYSAVQI